jgi:exonuclease III
MDHNKKWNFLAWNVRGVNSQPKWDTIRNKVTESNCAIVCLQETKHTSFDNMYLRMFYLRHLDTFAVCPSPGAFGGLITIWNSNIFEAEVLLINSYSITVKFRSLPSGQIFYITNIYGPAASVDKKLD